MVAIKWRVCPPTDVGGYETRRFVRFLLLNLRGLEVVGVIAPATAAAFGVFVLLLYGSLHVFRPSTVPNKLVTGGHEVINLM